MRDLVAVPPVRTVVRLADLRQPELRAALETSFVLTADAEHCLRTVLRDVRGGRGRGYFVEGSFGAGKSHLLAILLELAGRGLSPERLGAELGEGLGRRSAGLGDADLPARPLLAVGVSLVEYSARESLEEAVVSSIARAAGPALGGDGGPGLPPRREAFARVRELLLRPDCGGLLLCLDELSEFLRSKPDGRSFSEDVRFLQFLGEWAEEAPAWIVCSAQEAIEQTGDLPAAVFGRIRDRYPVRFHLGGGHIKELIERRLVRKLAGAEEALGQLYAGLRQTFGALPFSAEEFVRLYPVHPGTVELLDQLRPLFSQQRGVIDFVVARLAGDPARRIPALLDQPADRLLAPDAIVDHFRDRVRDRPETAPLANLALPYFEQELVRVLGDEATARLGARLGRMLIAGALCPTPRGFTARELADALLHRFTGLDPGLNLEFVQETLERMARDGAYVSRREESPPSPGAAPVVRYYCDLQADLSLVVARRLAYWRSSLLPDDARVWTLLAPWCEDPSLPLARLRERPRAQWEVTWRRTPRRVLVWLARVTALEAEEVREVGRSLETSETDAALLVATPEPGEAEAAPARWTDELAPALAALRPELPVLLWAPRAPSAAEVERLRDAVAHALLEAEVAADRSAISERLSAHLASGAAERRREVALLYRTLYLEGNLRDLGGTEFDLGRWQAERGAQPFAALLEAVCEEPLARRFPLHPDLPTRPDLLNLAAAERAVADLARAGETSAEAPLDPAARAVLDHFLLPLGLCRRSARGYRLTVDARSSPLAGDLLGAVGAASPAAPLPLAEAYGRLRKGPAGVPRRVFELLVFTLVQSGAVSAVKAARRLPPGQVRVAHLWEAEGLAAGALVDPELQAGLEDLPFLPPRLRRGPLTYAVQREAWEAVVDWKREWMAALPALRAEAEAARGYRSLQQLLDPDLLADLDRLTDLLSAVVPSLPAQEGLQRVLEAFAARPTAARTLERVTLLREFLERRLSGYMIMVGYLDSEEFVPPPELAARARELRALLRDPAEVLGPGFARLDQEFASLRQAYAAAYTAAHEEAVGPGAFAAHEAVAQTAAFRLAAALGEVPGLTVEPDAVSVKAALDAALAPRCAETPAALADRLRRLPVCTCGFRLDRRPVPPPPAELDALARASAAAYLTVLRAPEQAERLRAYAEGLRTVGREADAAALAALADIPPSAADAPARALAVLERVGAEEVRWALAGRALVVDRDAGALLERLTGRAMRPEQLVRLVQDWLGEPAQGTFVRVVAPGRGAREAARAAAPPPPAAPRPADPGPGGRPRCAEAVQRYRDGLRALRAAAEAPPASAAAWADLWLGPAGQTARWGAEAYEAALAARGVSEWPFAAWRAEALASAATLARAFAAFAARGTPEPAGGLSSAVLEARALVAGRPSGRVFVWCLDGLRCDLLATVLEGLGEAGAAWDEVKRGVGWAVSPTTTAMQFEALRGVGFDGELVRWDEGTDEALATDADRLLAEVDWTRGRGDGCICKWDFIDGKVHGSSDDYGTFCAEVRLQASRRLGAAARALAPGDLVVLCADHGFRVLPRPSPDAPRYAHGGDSPDEVLAPWCVLRIGG